MVEKSPSKELFKSPLHPYTKALLSAIPFTDIFKPLQRVELKGEITTAINPDPGCRFAPLFPYATEACKQHQQLQEAAKDHFVAYCRLNEIS